LKGFCFSPPVGRRIAVFAGFSTPFLLANLQIGVLALAWQTYQAKRYFLYFFAFFDKKCSFRFTLHTPIYEIGHKKNA
jgi:hypothetical protein